MRVKEVLEMFWNIVQILKPFGFEHRTLQANEREPLLERVLVVLLVLLLFVHECPPGDLSALAQPR